MLLFAILTCTTVEPGHRGLEITFGNVDDKVLEPGFHWGESRLAV